MQLQMSSEICDSVFALFVFSVDTVLQCAMCEVLSLLFSYAMGIFLEIGVLDFFVF